MIARPRESAEPLDQSVSTNGPIGLNNSDISHLGFAEDQAVYTSATQNVRALSEGWVAAHLFCPSCGADRLAQLPNNSPVRDFACRQCAEEYELKAKQRAR